MTRHAVVAEDPRIATTQLAACSPVWLLKAPLAVLLEARKTTARLAARE